MIPDRMPWEEEPATPSHKDSTFEVMRGAPVPPEQQAAAVIDPGYDASQWGAVRIAPEKDAGLQVMLAEGNRLLELAKSRTVACNADREPISDDLVIIARSLKQIESKRLEFTKPLNAFLGQINAYFKAAAEPFAEANSLNRSKIRVYDAEVERRRQEAARIEAEKLALARREAELNNGEITIDLSPVPVPTPVPTRVFASTGGSMSPRKEPRWELEDLTLVPDEYLTLDTVKIGKVVRAGVRQIPGIRIWEESNVVVRT